ncbi:MAG: sialidase family protein [Petrimonas sp.]|nr:sialidase family protein [Petrimonas sp.]HMM16169.1 sialidase family protein [Petrimonas sp.]
MKRVASGSHAARIDFGVCRSPEERLFRHRQYRLGDTAFYRRRRVFVIHSDTDGLSWSAPVEITSEVKKEDWTWYATGPAFFQSTFDREGEDDRTN